jgi:hypothetical protein
MHFKKVMKKEKLVLVFCGCFSRLVLTVAFVISVWGQEPML